MVRSRGIRNCNPGNIRKSGRPGLYRGEIEGATDPEFRQFAAMEWGYRALFTVLYTYEVRHGLRTPRQWISRWAPPSENHTEAYLRFVCERVGIAPDSRLSTLDRKIMIPFAAAMSEMENGVEAIEEEVVAGWELFFVDFGPKSAKKR